MKPSSRLIGAVLGLIGLVLGALLLVQMRRGEPVDGEGSPLRRARPAAPLPRDVPSYAGARREKAASSADRFLIKGAGPQEESWATGLSFAQLMGYLKAGAEDPRVKPAADRFARDFGERPELKGVYEEFKAADAAGQRPAATAFMERLRVLPSFHELVDKAIGQGGSQALLVLAQRPAIGSFISTHAAALASRRAAGASVRGAGADVPAGGAGRLGAFVASAGWLGSGAGAPASVAASLAAPGSGGAAGAPESASDARGPDAHDVGRLDKGFLGQGSKAAGDDQFLADRKFLTEFLKRLPDGARRALEARLGAEDLWGSCWSTGYYDTCASICPVVSGCGTKNPWDACRSGNTRSAATCAQDCLDGRPQPCVPPRSDWDPLCKAASIPQSYCGNDQEYGPVYGCVDIPAVGRTCKQALGGRPAPVAPRDVPDPGGGPAATPTPSPAAVCNRATQPSPDYGEKGGACLPSCRRLAAASPNASRARAQQDACARGETDLGDCYDGAHCCVPPEVKGFCTILPGAAGMCCYTAGRVLVRAGPQSRWDLCASGAGYANQDACFSQEHWDRVAAGGAWDYSQTIPCR
ncbi:MAG: hypothetical protein HY553_09630 [Elusimicrobia bacterium]|nr:hypothetical protein [Elusimicrobiota bacterium]